MKEKTHTRAAGMKSTSIAVPEILLEKVQEIADREARTRNKQIELYLRMAVEDYEKYHGHLKTSAPSVVRRGRKVG
jgi:metal-responsive CopG/Arc/MetJ family transcriptional regulator